VVLTKLKFSSFYRILKMSDSPPKPLSVYHKVMDFIMADQHPPKPSQDFGNFYDYINATGLQTLRVELSAPLLAHIAHAPAGRFSIQRDPLHGADDEFHGHCDIGCGCEVALTVACVCRHFFKSPALVPPDAKVAVAKVLGVSPDLFEAYWIEDNEKRVLLLECRPASPVTGDGKMADDKLYRIAFVSTALKLFDRMELLGILQQCRERNVRVEITGLLLYRDGQFMQILEGRERAVKEEFVRISQRPEHYGIMVLVEEHIEQRHFADWSMAYQDLDWPKESNVPGYSQFLNTPLTEAGFVANPSRCEKILHLFKKNIR
jgi:uncharacterized protein YozE (UPF0346 family)